MAKVAVVQAAPVAFDLERTLAKLADLTADAARGGAQLVLFPEAFVSAYPRGTSFGTVIGSRTPDGREWYRRYHASSIEVPGPGTDRLAAIARDNRVHLVVGVIERDGGTLYCTIAYLGPDGAYLGKHRKLIPTAAERLVWGFGDGSTLPVIETQMGRLSGLVCWENLMPAARMALYGKGVELYCAPTADARESWIPTVRHIAMEGRCFVLSANQYATRADYPTDFDTIFGDDPAAVFSRGGSCIVGPLGELLVDPVYDREAILHADLDLDEIVRARFDFDPVGHYARPDVFQLVVDERPKPAVRTVTGEEPTT